MSNASGRNVVLDFIAQVKLEIQLVSWSKTAGKIAKFYDTCGGYYKFMFNSVVKMILEETEYNSMVKKYLYQRFFQYIEQDKIKDLDRIFNNNERLTNDIKAKEDKYIELQDKVNREIKERGISSNVILNSLVSWDLTPPDIARQESIEEDKTKG